MHSPPFSSTPSRNTAGYERTSRHPPGRQQLGTQHSLPTSQLFEFSWPTHIGPKNCGAGTAERLALEHHSRSGTAMWPNLMHGPHDYGSNNPHHMKPQHETSSQKHQLRCSKEFALGFQICTTRRCKMMLCKRQQQQQSSRVSAFCKNRAI